ncbi:putative phiE125 gp8 family phage protein [Phyllobacterium ifriqiyense]|uniref:PhiE125 gp8 family phage protein n=1 Tax=Phyllobacterium ifriqiyense TaxID=314238 RepID=A0ABU0S7Z7_9HYPH|nr:phage head-tail connector protein [Phyllobacterium ifriqiyense]MDQ0996883.1 putative phiE125 gp8 family phage protein [Phyllobacterium ifriqiyense]
MNIKVITPPAPVVTLPDAKAFLRVDFDDDNTLINGLIAAASKNIDGPFGWLDRAIGTQTLELGYTWYSCRYVELPFGPVQSVESVKYIDSEGVEQTVPEENYFLDGDCLHFVSGYSYPSVSAVSDPVKIRYVAGFETVPADVVLAVKLHIKMNFDPLDEPGRAGMQRAIDDLLRSYKKWSL